MPNPDAKPADAVSMRLDLSRADRERVRLRAALAGVEMSVWLRRLVLAELERLDMADSFNAVGRKPPGNISTQGGER